VEKQMNRIALAAPIALLSILSLSAFADVRGVAMTREGAPLAKAKVSVYTLETTAAMRARWQSESPQRVAVATVETSTNGSFSVKVDAPVALLQIESAGFAPAALRVAKDEDVGAIALVVAGEKKGSVRSGSTAVGGARVVWISVGGAEWVAVTDAEGRYAVPDPDKWAQRVTVVHADYAIDAEAALPPQTKIPLERRLVKGVAIEGRVTAADGKTAVANADVFVDGWKLGVSGDDGAFSVAHASAKWQELRAVSGAASAAVSPAKGSISLRLAKTAKLTGVVRDAQAKLAVAGAEVMALPSEGDLVARTLGRASGISAITDAKGAFTIELVSGSYELQVVAPGYSSASTDVTIPTGGAVDRSLPLTKLARVAGSVIDDDKRPVAAAWVMPVVEPSRMGRGARTRLVSGFGAMSGPDGRFVLRSLQPDEDAELEATRKGLPSGKAPSMKLASGETKSGVVITIPRGIEVTGIVTDEGGEPVSGVTVTSASPERGGGGRMMIRMVLGESAGADDVQTGSDGRFSMRLAEGRWDLLFRREGFAPYRSSAIDVRPGVAPVEVTLQPGAEIAGRVVRSGGAGVDAVTISSMMGGIPSNTTTGPDGSFVLKDMAPGSVMLMVRKPEEFIQVMRTVNAPTKDLTIEVPKGESVSGRVIDKASGQPVTEFSAGVSGESGGGGMRIIMQPVMKSFRTDDGTFHLEGLPTGPLQMIVSAPGYVQQKVPGLVLEEGKPIRDLEVALETGTKISGRVTGPDGKPLASVDVRPEAPGRGAGTMAGGVTTDAEGNYQLEAVEAGEKTVVFRRDGYPSTRKTVTVSGREMKLDVQLGRGATIAGVVVSEGGSPVAGAQVYVENSSYGGSDATSDANGNFRFEGLSEGRYSVAAQKTGYVEAQLDDVDAATAGNLRLVLGQGGRITGRVTGLQASEYSQVRVSASTSTAGADARPDSTGAFTIEGVPVGTVRVMATKGAGFAGSMQTTEAKTVEISAGGEAMVDLEFRTDKVVTGRVTRNRVALEGASVRFNPKNPAIQTRGTATTDASGKYEVRGLQDGEYEVTVFDSMRMSAHTETRQVSGSVSVDVDIVTASLRGRVTDSDTGSGVSGARISFEPKSGESSGMITRRIAESDASGSFLLDNIVPGSYSARAEKDGYGQDVRDVEVSDSGADGVDFKIGKNDGIRLRVVDARSGTALGGQVRVTDPLGRTAYEGSFAASSEGTKISLAPGSYRLSIFANGYAPMTSGVTAPSASTALGLTPGGTVEIEFDGSEAASARLLDASGADYQRWFWMRQPSFRVDPGVTTLRNIAAGTYTLALLDESGNVAKSWPISVVEGRAAKVRVTK
jgi:hypothetical protein